MNSIFKISKASALQKLTESNFEFEQVLQHGTLEIEFYKPIEIDKQQPHHKDEIYIIASGNSKFYHEGEITEVGTGDCLFVAAYNEHRFFNFSNDFAVWAIFYGPEGGEKP